MKFRPSIRLLITLLVVGPIIVAATILLIVSATTANAISNDLGAQLTAAATASVERELERYLSAAVRTSDLYTRRLRLGTLSPRELGSWRVTLLDDLATTNDVASICFANPQGDATWLLRAHGRVEYGLVDGRHGGAAVEHAIDPRTGTLAPTALRNYQYVAQERPWYRAALASQVPVWTPIYFWFGEGGAAAETGTGYTRPIHSQNAALLGVLVIDVTLGDLSAFLRRLPLAEKGALFIVDDKGFLVAASRGDVNSQSGQRLALRAADDPAARAAADGIARQATADKPIDAGAMLAVDVEGEPVRMSISRLQPDAGIDWRLLILVPQREFMGRAVSLRNRSLLLACLVGAVSILVGLWFSRQLTAPLLALVRHVQRVGRGDFASRVDLHAAKELVELSAEMNLMADGLKERLELERALGLAMEVQQCLLPDRSPSVPGFEVASRSRYCDATGGDYFDFLDIAPMPRDGLFVAVGDVTGHGIASALVMASARSALRAYAIEEPNLAVLMTKVNRAFSSDSRHGHFMTLALLVMDAPTSAIRWASAGHDPTIAYDPATDGFMDSEGGDLPLGVVEDNAYEEYRRESLVSGSVLLLGTDGIWETVSPAGEAYGKERLRAVIRASHRLSSEAIADAIEADLNAFRGPVGVLDDVTFVVIKLRASG